MTGREKIEAAFTAAGAPEIPVMICYEDLYIRDHWAQLTREPWWARHTPDVEARLRLLREIAGNIGQDVYRVPWFYSAAERQTLAIEVRPDRVYRVNRRTGEETPLREPQVGGWTADGASESVHPDRLPATREEIDRLIPEPAPFDRRRFLADGHGDLAARLRETLGLEKAALYHVSSPLWRCYGLWGFEGLMTLVADQPDLVDYACRRALPQALNDIHVADALGARLVWIEECLTDMISPEAFARLNLPHVRRLVREIQTLGMKSLYYFCGNPEGKWNQILATGTDALALEEGKKGFRLEIEDIVARVSGRCVVVGNLDAVGVLQQADEAGLRREIARQLAAGRQNGGRFIMSIGSPVTPETPVARVRRYCALARELGDFIA